MRDVPGGRSDVQSPKAQKGERTREELLGHSLRLFAAQGFSHTSLDDVAAAAGLTKGAIYWHFKGKGELFDAIIDRIGERWNEAVRVPARRMKDPRRSLAAMFDGYEALFTRSPEMCLFLQRVLLDRHHRQSAARVSAVFAQTARFVTRVIEDGQSLGYFRRDLDARLTAHVMLGAIAGATQQCLVSRKITITTAIREARALILARVSPTTATGRLRSSSRWTGQ